MVFNADKVGTATETAGGSDTNINVVPTQKGSSGVVMGGTQTPADNATVLPGGNVVGYGIHLYLYLKWHREACAANPLLIWAYRSGVRDVPSPYCSITLCWGNSRSILETAAV